MTHWIVEIEVWKSRPSVGIATFTIVASRIAMIVPTTTTPPSTRISRSSVSCCDIKLSVALKIWPQQVRLHLGDEPARAQEAADAPADRRDGAAPLPGARLRCRHRCGGRPGGGRLRGNGLQLLPD